MSLVVETIGPLVIALQAAIILGLALWFIQKTGLYDVAHLEVIQTIKGYLHSYANEAAFFIAFFATSGSLYFSEILQMEPCPFCWYQRIFMYPLAVILGVSIFLRKSARDFVIPLSMIGAAISIYHIAIQIIGESIATGCGDTGVSCTVVYIDYAGYVTIPVMAFTAFTSIILLQWKFREE